MNFNGGLVSGARTIGHRRPRSQRPGRSPATPEASGAPPREPGSLHALCDTGRLGFSLDEASQGMLGAALFLGSDPPFCFVFGGHVTRDEPGHFAALGAPMPGRCGIP